MFANVAQPTRPIRALADDTLWGAVPVQLDAHDASEPPASIIFEGMRVEVCHVVPARAAAELPLMAFAGRNRVGAFLSELRELVLAGDVAGLQKILDAAKTVEEEVEVPELDRLVRKWCDGVSECACNMRS